MKVNFCTGLARGGVELGNMSGRIRSHAYPKEVHILAYKDVDESFVGVNIVLSKEELKDIITSLNSACEDLAVLDAIERIEND